MGGRTARRLLIAIIAVLALLLIADRVGVVIAEHTAGDTIQSSQHLRSRPDVDIAGFPFLTQLATGNYDKITVTANDVPLNRAARFLVLSRLKVVLHSLTVSRDFSSFRAKTATATAVIGYPDLGKAVGATIRYAGGGQLAISKSVSVAGTSIGGTLRIRPQLLRGALSFAGTTLTALPLQGIPFKITVQTLAAAPDGLVIGLAGTDLAFHS
jgi:hypothetical protein